MMAAAKRVEGFFGYPLPEVLATLRSQGCTWRVVALALNVSRPQVYLWRKKFGIEDGRRLFDDLSQKEAKIDGNARQLGYRNAQEAIVDLRGKHTLAETAAILGVHPRTVTKHYPPGFSGTMFVKTKLYVDSRQRTGWLAVKRRRERRKLNPSATWRSL